MLAAWFACAFGSSAVPADQSPPAASQPEDLTGMSLEQLLDEEITPINVLGSHTHLKGGFMFGYRYMYMDMSHNQEGTRDVSLSESRGPSWVPTFMAAAVMRAPASVRIDGVSHVPRTKERLGVGRYASVSSNRLGDHQRDLISRLSQFLLRQADPLPANS